MTGKRVGYTNWKDASPNGNCAYLFTKVRQSLSDNNSFFCSDRSWQQGQVGGRHLLHQLRAQPVHHLPVRRGRRRVLHPWHVSGEREPICNAHILTTFQANTLDREYTLEYGLGKQDGVARPFLKGRMNTNIKFNITSRMWEMRHLHSPNYALLTDPRAKGGSVYPVGRWRVSSLFHLTMVCRYKWLVFNPECNTINKEISLTLSRSYKASVQRP